MEPRAASASLISRTAVLAPGAALTDATGDRGTLGDNVSVFAHSKVGG